MTIKLKKLIDKIYRNDVYRFTMARVGYGGTENINDQRIKIGMDEKNQENKNAYMK